MVNKLKAIALAGAIVMVAPAFAQAAPPLNPFNLDLDPFHLFTSAPMKKHHFHKKMMHKMMMHKKMMHKKMMKK